MFTTVAVLEDSNSTLGEKPAARKESSIMPRRRVVLATMANTSSFSRRRSMGGKVSQLRSPARWARGWEAGSPSTSSSFLVSTYSMAACLPPGEYVMQARVTSFCSSMVSIFLTWASWMEKVTLG